ncbi:MAG: DUF971 domain-containing protein [Chlorobi bacterium]|nr:DUF971 domain-containing protein [Chlorobiota bacterium]
MKPSKLEIKESKLFIIWKDETASEIELPELRKNCPCAYCTTQEEGSDDMRIRRFTVDQLTVARLEIVGNYALKVVWKDGHNLGIYTFESLKEMADN